MPVSPTTAAGVEVRASLPAEYATILTAEALDFVATLQRAFDARRRELLRAVPRSAQLDQGWLPDFLPETRMSAKATGRSRPCRPNPRPPRRDHRAGRPQDGHQRAQLRGEGVHGGLRGRQHAHLGQPHPGPDQPARRIRRTIDIRQSRGQGLQAHDKTATLLVRPRGWHLPEKHVLVDGKAVSGGSSISGCIFFHNARELLRARHRPVLLPAEAGEPSRSPALERRLRAGPGRAGLPRGTVRATVLIETILAAFEMDEILYELRDHSAGLNCGRWDYIFTCIKKFRSRPDFCLPDRARVTMTTPFHEELRATADQDLPSARRPCHGGHGGADSHQERSAANAAGVARRSAGQGTRGR